MSPHPQVIVIGLDGMNLRLIQQLLPSDSLPTLRKLIGSSAVGDLTSVFPTHSAAAWSSFITGQTPASHGVFDFKVRLPDGHYRHAKPDPTDTLWHILGEHGCRVGVYNFPVSFPPDRVNGWMVSGMLSTDLDRLSYPSGLAGELLQTFPDYRLDVEWLLYEGRPDELLRDLTAMVRQRGDVARYLLARQPLDFFAIAFIATDRAQHVVWRYLDPTHPHYTATAAEQLRPAIHEFYRTLDDAVAGLLETVSPDTQVILLSDHGFQPAVWQFHVEEWLAQQGWLVYQSRKSAMEKWIRRLDTPPVRHLRQRLFHDISRHISAFTPGGTLDWARTRALCPWNFHQGIRINLRGRDPHGIVSPGREFEQIRDEISSALTNLRHPETSQPVVASLYRSDTLYRGAHLADMPDLIFDLQPNFAPGIHRPRLFEPTGWVSGDHSLNGFVLLHGAGVTPGVMPLARLIDIAPTILQMFGIPSPNTMDGRALPIGIIATRMAAPPPNGELLSHNQSGENAPLTTEEESRMLEQLHNLGYL